MDSRGIRQLQPICHSSHFSNHQKWTKIFSCKLLVHPLSHRVLSIALKFYPRPISYSQCPISSMLICLMFHHLPRLLQMVLKHGYAVFPSSQTPIHSVHSTIPSLIKNVQCWGLTINHFIGSNSNRGVPIGIIPPFSQKKP